MANISESSKKASVRSILTRAVTAKSQWPEKVSGDFTE